MRVEVNGIKLNVILKGCQHLDDEWLQESPVLIAVSGGPGFSHTFLKPGLDPVSEQYPLIYFDPRGTGQSDSGDKSSWTLEQHAKDIVELCHVLDIKKPILLGHSAGAHYAVKAATLAPDLIAGLILSNPITLSKTVVFEQLLSLGGEASQRFIIDLDEHGYGDYMATVLPKYDPIERPLSHLATLEANVEQFLHMFHGLLDQSFWALLEQLPATSALLLLGKFDPIYPWDHAQNYLQNASNDRWKMQLFEQSGHDNLLCEPEKFVLAVKDFMQEKAYC